jgi:hypothetical protein
MKRAMKGDFDLFGQADKLYASIDKITDGKVAGENYYQEKMRYVKNFKKAILLVLHAASKHFEKKFGQEQEIMNNLSDMIMETYISESAALRVQKMETLNGTAMSLYKDILDVNIYDAAEKIKKAACDAVYSFALAADATKLTKAVDILTVVTGINIKDARRRIADKLIEDNTYKF